MREKLNCPNCGAPITDIQCAYCGTMFYDFATMEVGKPQAVRVKYGDQHLTFNAYVKDFEVSMKSNAECFYADNIKCYATSYNNFEINLTLESMPDDKGVFLTKRIME